MKSTPLPKRRSPAPGSRSSRAATARRPPKAPARRAGGLDDTPRGRILRAASQLFVTRGFARTTVRDLAAEVGIQSGSLFHHFPSKAAILEEVMREVIELNSHRMQEAFAHTHTPLEGVEALVRCELTSINGDTSEAMSLLLLEWESLDGPAQKRVLRLRDRYEALWLTALERAKTDLVELAPFVVRRLLAGMHSQTAYWFRPDDPMTIDDLTGCVMKLIARPGHRPANRSARRR